MRSSAQFVIHHVTKIYVHPFAHFIPVFSNFPSTRAKNVRIIRFSYRQNTCCTNTFVTRIFSYFISPTLLFKVISSLLTDLILSLYYLFYISTTIFSNFFNNFLPLQKGKKQRQKKGAHIFL